ncbi:hypothetical protein AMR42_11800 [Limnothrix sp. PR1529]|nr:hypothetical protein BCR12_02785 [Limnothrix sp. P13C2]PIB09928.1 hypothetical protein AMR42_11800 [Limnothrix sp. PR1529]
MQVFQGFLTSDRATTQTASPIYPRSRQDQDLFAQDLPKIRPKFAQNLFVALIEPAIWSAFISYQ